MSERPTLFAHTRTSPNGETVRSILDASGNEITGWLPDSIYVEKDALWRILPRWCEACQGSGVVPEDHGPGLTEYLACQDCYRDSDGQGWLYPDPPKWWHWAPLSNDPISGWRGHCRRTWRAMKGDTDE